MLWMLRWTVHLKSFHDALDVCCNIHFNQLQRSSGSYVVKSTWLLCTTKLAQSTSRYYSPLQSLHKLLPSNRCLLQKLAKTTSQWFFVLQSLHKALASTTLYYNSCTKQLPLLLCTTKLAQTTSQYYFVLQSLHKALRSTTLYYKSCTKQLPVLLCTTKLAQSSPRYDFVLQ